MAALIKKLIKSNSKKTLIFLAISLLISLMYVAIFPSMQKDGPQLIEGFKDVDFYQGMDIRILDMFKSLEGFMAAENYSIMWPILMIIFVISYASSTLAGEINKGNIELLLSQPLSRSQIFLAKYLSGLFLTLTLVFSSNLLIIPLAKIAGIDVNYKSYIMISITGGLFSIAIYSLTFMFSSMYSSAGKPASLIMAILIFMYAIKILANVEQSIDFLKYLSFFHYYDSNAALIDNSISTLSLIIFGAVTLLSTIVGIIYFDKRDIAA